MTEREVRTQIGLVLGRLGFSRDLRRFITNLCWRSVQHVVLVEERVGLFKNVPFGWKLFMQNFVNKVLDGYVERCVYTILASPLLVPIVRSGKVGYWRYFDFLDEYEIYESPLKVYVLKNKLQ